MSTQSDEPTEPTDEDNDGSDGPGSGPTKSETDSSHSGERDLADEGPDPS